MATDLRESFKSPMVRTHTSYNLQQINIITIYPRFCSNISKAGLALTYISVQF